MNKSIPADARAFLEKVLDQTNPTFTSPEEKEDVILELYDQLDALMTSRMLERLTPEEVTIYTQMITDKRPQVEIQSYLMSKIPDLQDVMQKAMIEFHELYSDSNKQASS